jgi:hypothetical protein
VLRNTLPGAARASSSRITTIPMQRLGRWDELSGRAARLHYAPNYYAANAPGPVGHSLEFVYKNWQHAYA